MSDTPLSDVERIKAASRHLRGSLAESLTDPLTGALADDDTQLSKFHGIYQQDDRDVRAERRKRKLEPAHSFMIRVRVPGGLVTGEQWLALDSIADEYANGTLRLTTRQAVQYHGIVKRGLKQAMAAINETLLDTLAACGDVNRNVMCTTHPDDSALHRQVYEAAQQVHDHLTPRTGAYHEIWLDGEKVTSSEAEPIYGDTYLPRKFKSVVALPPVNDVDIFAHDLG
ncbi:MAG: sulfite reductase, partial [Pseudomonadota bacterium]